MKTWSLCGVVATTPKPNNTATSLAFKGDRKEFVAELAAIIPAHYITQPILERNWKRQKLARFLNQQLPASKRGRSGNLGEILATEYVNEELPDYEVPIKRLRWTDGRSMSMRGDDIVGIDFASAPIKFLKGECKSGSVLSKAQITKAREGLNNNAGLPNAHTIGFVMQRLFEADEDAKATALEDYSEGNAPQKEHVTHMIFTFSGNDPNPLFLEDITASTVTFAHMSIGLWCADHQKVIAESYQEAANGSV
jgi:hypothetical protein